MKDWVNQKNKYFVIRKINWHNIIYNALIYIYLYIYYITLYIYIYIYIL